MSRSPVRLFPPSAAVALALFVALARPCAATMPPLFGTIPPEVRTAFQDGAFRVPPHPAGLGTSVVLPTWRVPVIMVSFSDQQLVHTGAEFEVALFDTTHSTPTGSVYDYYRWTSGNRCTVLGRVVATVQLPNPRSYYAYNSWGLSRTTTPHNSAGLVYDALAACQGQVNWTEFDMDHDGFVDMLWVIHQGMPGEASPDRFDNNIWSITSRLSGYWTNSDYFDTGQVIPGTGQHYRVDRFTMLPELSYFKPGQRSEIGVYCHEFGHALGLPDLYDTRDGGAVNSGLGNWSLMATGCYGGDNHSPEYPTHVSAWPALFMGWTQPLRPSGDTPMVLPPVGNGLQLLDLCFQGESATDHFLVETRRREGFDRNLPADGLVVYHADEIVIGQGLQSNQVNSQMQPGLVLLEADGHSDLTTGLNRGDAADPFPGASLRAAFFDQGPAPNTRTFYGAPVQVGLFDIRDVPEGSSFFAQVRAPGWQTPVDATMGTFAPSGTPTPGRTAALAPDGTLYSVASEVRSGRQQIVLRTGYAGSWDEGIQVSFTTGNAFEPALAPLGSDGIAVVWSDTRAGVAQLFYRALVRGGWTDERMIYGGSGDSRGASIAVDASGLAHVSWIFAGSGLPGVRYMRFPYLSPPGQVYSLSSDNASCASVSAGPGGAIVGWVANRTWPPRLWFARCGPDSLPGPALTLTEDTGNSQTWLSTIVDSVGTLHAAWIETGFNASELHYQRRPAWAQPQDTILETSTGTLAHPEIAIDHAGGIHVAFERSSSGLSQVRYRRRSPDWGWDAFSTDVTTSDMGAAVQPSILPTMPGNVMVLYRGYQGTAARFMERIRATDYPPLLAVGPELVSAPPRAVAYPNPSRAGAAVELRWSTGARPAATALDVFDLLGRRVATAPLEPAGAWLRARLAPGATRAWAPGVYLVRPRGAGGPAQRMVIVR